MPTTAERNEETIQRERFLGEYLGWSHTLTERDAQNLAGILGVNPALAPDTAAALVVGGVSWDDPFLSEIADADFQITQDWTPMHAVRGTVRGALTGLESYWDHGVNTLLRTGVRAAQGEDLWTAYRISNQSYLTEITRQARMGNPIRMGSGWTYGSEQDHQLPGYSTALRSKYDETHDLRASMSHASALTQERYGVPITDNIHDLHNSTLINKTFGDQTYSVPASMGRALAITVFRPDTTPFNVASGLADLSFRIFADPINRPAYELGMWAMNRKAISLSTDAHVRDHIRRLMQENENIFHEPGAGPSGQLGTASSDSTNAVPRITMYPEAIEADWNGLLNRYHNAPDELLFPPDRVPEGVPALDPHQTADLGSPYQINNLTVREFVDEINARGGLKAYEDYVLEHELIHQRVQGESIQTWRESGKDHIIARHDDAYYALQEANARRVQDGLDPMVDEWGVRQVDDAGNPIPITDEEAQLIDDYTKAHEEFKHEIVSVKRGDEMEAEILAWKNMLEDNMEVHVLRAEHEAKVGINVKWRKWLKHTQADDWLMDPKKSDDVVNFLAREKRWEHLARRLPTVKDDSIITALQHANTAEEVREILRPLLGREIYKTPGLGLSKYSDHLQIGVRNPTARHSFGNNKAVRSMRLGLRRYGAQSQPIVLSLMDPYETKQAVIQWMRTIRASDEEIQAVLSQITMAHRTKDMGALTGARDSMYRVLSRKLAASGYTEPEIMKILEQVATDEASNASYWLNYAASPQEVQRMRDVELFMQQRVANETMGNPTVPLISAVHEAQYTNTRLVVPNLRDTRRATAHTRALNMRVHRAIPGLNPERIAIGFESGIGLRALDTLHKYWRDIMLLRMGWPIRVIGEELLRGHAYGYGEWLTHPMDILAQIKNTDGLYSLMGDDLVAMIRRDGLGAGGWRESDQIYDMSRQNWTAARRGQSGYERGVLTELLQLRGSRVARIVSDVGVDEALRILSDPNNEAMRALLVSIQKRAKRGSLQSKIIVVRGNRSRVNEAVLREHLESLDAMIHQQTGGRWIERTSELDAGGRPIFKDMWGNQIHALQDQHKRAELLEMAKQRGITGRHGMNKDQLASAIHDADGTPDVVRLATEHPNRQFHIVEEGNGQLRRAISDGTLNDEPFLLDNMKISEIAELEPRILSIYDELGATPPEVVRTMIGGLDEVAKKQWVDRLFEVLMQVPTSRLVRQPHFLTRYLDHTARMYLGSTVEQRAVIEAMVEQNNMGRAWQRALKKQLEIHGLRQLPGGPLNLDELDKGRYVYAKIRDQADTVTDELTEVIKGVEGPDEVAAYLKGIGTDTSDWQLKLNNLHMMGMLPENLIPYVDEGIVPMVFPDSTDLARRGANWPATPGPTPRMVQIHDNLLDTRSSVDAIVARYGDGVQRSDLMQNFYELELVKEHFDELNEAARVWFGDDPDALVVNKIHDLDAQIKQVGDDIRTMEGGGSLRGRGGSGDSVPPPDEVGGGGGVPERDMSYSRPVMDYEEMAGDFIENLKFYDEVGHELEEAIPIARRILQDEYGAELLEMYGVKSIDEIPERALIDHAYRVDGNHELDGSGWIFSPDVDEYLFSPGFRSQMEGAVYPESILRHGRSYEEWDWLDDFRTVSNHARRELQWYLDANGLDLVAEDVIKELRRGTMTIDDLRPAADIQRTKAASQNLLVNKYYNMRSVVDEIYKGSGSLSVWQLNNKPISRAAQRRINSLAGGDRVEFLRQFDQVKTQFEASVKELGVVEAHRTVTGAINPRGYAAIQDSAVLYEDLLELNARIDDIAEQFDLRAASWEVLSEQREHILITRQTEHYDELGNEITPHSPENVARLDPEDIEALNRILLYMESEGMNTDLWAWPASIRGPRHQVSAWVSPQEVRELEYLMDNAMQLRRELRGRTANRGPLPPGIKNEPAFVDAYYGHRLEAYRKWTHPWWSDEVTAKIHSMTLDELIEASGDASTPAGFYLGLPRDVHHSVPLLEGGRRTPMIVDEIEDAFLLGDASFVEHLHEIVDQVADNPYLWDLANEAELQGIPRDEWPRFFEDRMQEISRYADKKMFHSDSFDFPANEMAHHSTLRMEVLRRLSEGEISIADVEEAIGRWHVNHWGGLEDYRWFENPERADLIPEGELPVAGTVGGLDRPRRVNDLNATFGGLEAQLRGQGIWEDFKYTQPIDRPIPDAEVNRQFNSQLEEGNFLPEIKYPPGTQPIPRYEGTGSSQSIRMQPEGISLARQGAGDVGGARRIPIEEADPMNPHLGGWPDADDLEDGDWLFHGTRAKDIDSFIGPDGELIMAVAQGDFHQLDPSFSFTTDIGEAHDYRTRTFASARVRNHTDAGHIIKIDADYIKGLGAQQETMTEWALYGRDGGEFTVPAGKWGYYAEHPAHQLKLEAEAMTLEELQHEWLIASSEVEWAEMAAGIGGPMGSAPELTPLSMGMIDDEIRRRAVALSGYEEQRRFIIELARNDVRLGRQGHYVYPFTGSFLEDDILFKRFFGFESGYDADIYELAQGIFPTPKLSAYDLHMAEEAAARGETVWYQPAVDAYNQAHASRKSFIENFDDLQRRVHAAEKPGNYADLTPEQRAAMDTGDWETFSRARGYTEDEISEFAKYQEFLEGTDPNKVQYPPGYHEDPLIRMNSAEVYEQKMREAKNMGYDENNPMGIKDPMEYIRWHRSGEAEMYFYESGAYLEADGGDWYRKGAGGKGNDGGRHKDSVPHPFSNRSLGVLTPEQQLVSDIDSVAKSLAIDDTKKLFYDLTSRSNITDQLRFIFPFGDAFIEQVGIWARAMTPLGDQAGQAIKNWRKGDIALQNARKSGFFSEDEFGNEVFNWPGAGLMADLFSPGLPDGVGLSATIRPDQLMMMNFTPRGLGLPGTHGFIQVPVSMVQNVLDNYPPLRDAINWFVYGDYTANQAQSPNDLLASLSPTYGRRLVEAWFGDESKQAYADEINERIETLLMTGDPQYGLDPDRRDHTIEDAKKFGSTLAWLRILDGIISPGQPRYEPTIAIQLDETEDPFWMQATALAREWRAAREFFGDDHIAAGYMRNRFGIDPFVMTGATREVVARPYDKQGYDYAMTHRDLYPKMGSSMMLFIPTTNMSEFYLPAYNRAKNEGDRQTLTPEQTMDIRSRTAGYNALNAIDEFYNAQAVEIDRAFDYEHNKGWSLNMQRLDLWRNQQRLDIYAQYPLSRPQSEIAGLAGRPTPQNILDDFLTVGTPGTEANALAHELQPDIAEWSEEVTRIWKVNLEMSTFTDAHSHSSTWWLTGESTVAQAMRDEAVDQINIATTELVAKADPLRKAELESQIGWFTTRVLEPLLNGYSGYDELWLLRTEVPKILTEAEIKQQYPEYFISDTVGAP